ALSGHPNPRPRARNPGQAAEQASGRKPTPYSLSRSHQPAADSVQPPSKPGRWIEAKGRQAITWSKGLRAPLPVADRTDEEIAAEEVSGDDLAVIHADAWRCIVRIPACPSLILDRAERGGLAAVNELLARYGAGQAQLPA